MSVTDIVSAATKQMYAIVTVVSKQDDAPYATVLARSAKMYSMAIVICIAPTGIQIDGPFDYRLVAGDVWDHDVQAYLEDYFDKYLYLPLNTLIIGSIDWVFMCQTPCRMPYGDVSGALLLKPSRMTTGLGDYDSYGYEWNEDSIYGSPTWKEDSAPSYPCVLIDAPPWKASWSEDDIPTAWSIWLGIYRGMGVHLASNHRGLLTHLKTILVPILGEECIPVIDKYESVYRQAFITKAANPSFNYDLLEAYGDRFLAGQFAWHLLEQPGIVTADQITKIGTHYQSNESIARITEALGLKEYIVLGPGENISPKMLADIYEALIGAIGISWYWYGAGDESPTWSIDLFVSYTMSTYLPPIDPIHYKTLYEHPKTSFKQLVEGLGLDRSLITETKPQIQKGRVMVQILYDKRPIGVSTITKGTMYMQDAIKMAIKTAYEDALKHKDLLTPPT
jgi:hypothetical protein